MTTEELENRLRDALQANGDTVRFTSAILLRLLNSAATALMVERPDHKLFAEFIRLNADVTQAGVNIYNSVYTDFLVRIDGARYNGNPMTYLEPEDFDAVGVNYYYAATATRP